MRSPVERNACPATFWRSTRSRRRAFIATGLGVALSVAGCSSSTQTAGTESIPPSADASTSGAPDTSALPATAVPAISAPTTDAPTTYAPTDSAPSTTVGSADPRRRSLIGGILESHRAAGEFVGAVIAVGDRDGSVTEVTSGTQSVEPGSRAVDTAVPWNIGSATKTFVAVVVLQLVDEGRIELDDPIQPYFPDLVDADRITVRDLLRHTSGLNEYLDKPAVINDMHRVWTPAELIAVAEAAGHVDEPGGAHHYANTNYILLGEIIRLVTGHRWDDEVRTRITEPLRMTTTSLIGDGQSSAGYVIADGRFVDATTSADPSTGGAAGALQSTARDLLRFASALADGSLLSAASRAAMQEFIPGEDYSQFGVTHGYGLGFERYATDDVTVDGHMGTGASQSAFLGYNPDDGTTVAVLTNTGIPGPQALMAVETLAAIDKTATA